MPLYSTAPALTTVSDIDVSLSPLPPRVSTEPSLDFHESDEDTGVSIPFTVNEDTADLTLPGTPLGEGQQVNLPEGEYGSSQVIIEFDLTNDQWIHLSEVRSG